MNQSLVYNHLNEFIQVIIQTDGMAFVVANYIALREQYYLSKT
jgi:hypothetical protein